MLGGVILCGYLLLALLNGPYAFGSAIGMVTGLIVVYLIVKGFLKGRKPEEKVAKK